MLFTKHEKNYYSSFNGISVIVKRSKLDCKWTS